MNTININTSIQKSIKIMNKVENKILVIIDNKKIIKGVITDGDIRRLFLKKIDYTKNISSIMNKKPFVIKEYELNKIKITDKTKKTYKYAIISDSKNKFVKLLNLQREHRDFNDMPIIIMAGGKGERLLPITKKLPKPLIKIGSTPMIFNLINQIYSQGYYNIYVSINFMKDLMKKKIGKLKMKNLNLKFIEESKPMGTAGSMFFLKKKKIKSKNFFVINCDIWSKLNLDEVNEFHKKEKADITVLVKNEVLDLDFGKVELKKNTVQKIIEKPSESFYFSAGIYVLKRNLLKYVKRQQIDMPEFINNMISKNKKVLAYYIYEDWIDAGTHSNLKKIRLKLN